MLLVGGLGTLCGVIGVVWYFFTPKYWEVGYMPAQPGGGFSHLIHVGKLGMDCRYCHSNVETSPEANIPSVSTCVGCHSANKLTLASDANSPHSVRTQFIRDAWGAGTRFDEIAALKQAGKLEEAKEKAKEYERLGLSVVEGGESIRWRRIHKLPDYVRNFPHNVHVNAGVSCYSCHGMIGRQAVVHQVQSLSMGWCLDCHRNPEPNLVPRDKVTDIFWVEQQMQNAGNPATAQLGSPGGKALLQALTDKPLHLLPENCGACHY
jgi:hypothetical protein